MIITGGSLRGRKLGVLSGGRTRPTPARVKEALFSILATQVPGARVLDLFAGSGALGFEALSRGAAEVVFVEAHPPTAAMLRETAVRFGIAEKCTIICGRSERSVSRLQGTFRLVFADPPYALPAPLPLFEELTTGGFLDDDAVIVYEHQAQRGVRELPAVLAVERQTHWGEVGVSFLRKVSAHSSRDLPRVI